MSQFKVGEMVVGQNFIYQTKRNGMEGQVSEPLQTIETTNSITRMSSNDAKYLVNWADGSSSWVRPKNLRRRPTPAGEQSILDMFSKPVAKEREIV